MINGSGSDPDGGNIVSYAWNQQSGPNTATLSGENTADLTASNLIAGTYIFRLTVTDDENDTDFDDMSVTVQSQPTVEIRINSGGPAFNFGGDSWAADQSFSPSNKFTNAVAIANTTNDQLYQSERWGRPAIGSFSYDIPVPNGSYDLNLHFAEIWFGAPGGGAGGAGSRVFDVNIENGQDQLTNYDIVVAAGGSAAAVVENFTGISVSDGSLTITFTGVVQNPKVSGIEILSAGGSSSKGAVVSNDVAQSEAASPNLTEALIASIYPNPANSEVSFKLNKSDTTITAIDIYDLNGRLVMQYSGDDLVNSGGIYTLNILGISDGVYVVNIRTSSPEVFKFSLVVQRE